MITFHNNPRHANERAERLAIERGLHSSSSLLHSQHVAQLQACAGLRKHYQPRFQDVAVADRHRLNVTPAHLWELEQDRADDDGMAANQ